MRLRRLRRKVRKQASQIRPKISGPPWRQRKFERRCSVKLRAQHFPKLCLVVVLTLVNAACNSAHHQTGNRDNASSSANTAANQQEFNPGLADLCLPSMAKSPSRPFHFSTVKTSDAGTYASEADISQQTMDVTSRNSTGTITNHYPRSAGWDSAIAPLVLAGPGRELNMAKFAVKSLGPETVNGFDTIKYAVDTTHEDPLDKAGYLAGMNVKDYNIVGTAWLTKDTGCILKYDIDFEMDGKDGKVSKTHYEGAITKR
jgi:hypothetical protein